MDISNKKVGYGLYIAFEYIIDKRASIVKESDGIRKKIQKQIETFERNGYKIDFLNPYANKNHKIRRIMRRLPFYFLNNWNFNFNNVEKYDFIYIRKAWFMDGDLIRFLRKVKSVKPEIKILLEIPTYPYDHEGNHLNMIPLLIKDKIWRKKLKKYIDRIITYSDDKTIFGIKTICISNAIDIKHITPRIISTENSTNSSINMIACSSLYYWHGYDRLIEGMKIYYESKSEKDPIVVLNIVGNGEEFSSYQEIVTKYNLEDYIKMPGKLFGEDLDKVYNRCEIGIDSLGRHRSGVSYNSSLKGKEYCAKGLLIVSGVKTELDNIDDYKYYMRVPANDSPIDIFSVINFYNSIFSVESPHDVKKSIESYAKAHFDFNVVMNSIIEYIS